MAVSIEDLTHPALLKLYRDTMLRSCGKPDSCIASSIVMAGVARTLGYEAQVFPVTVSILNAVFSAWYGKHQGRVPTREEEWLEIADRGGRLVVLGDDKHDPPAPGKWAGHMVAVIGDKPKNSRRRWLVDLTIDQAHRPEKGIPVESPIAAPIQGQWERFRYGDGQMVQERQDGVVIIYEARPENLVYREAPDWIHRRERYDPYIKALIRATKEVLKQAYD